MGITHCTCKKSDAEEDQVSPIFNQTLLPQLDIKRVYPDFLRCIKIEDYKEVIILKEFDNFLNKIVNPKSNHKDAQLDYFNILIKLNPLGRDSIKQIGTILILTAEGSFDDKLEILEKHIITYYGNSEINVKEFLNNLVELHTDCCLVAFKKYMESSWENTMIGIWKTHRKKNVILKFMDVYHEVYACSNEKSYLTTLNRFLSRVYNHLSGENVRNLLFENYNLDNNQIYLK
jgi:hypothetical protein